MHIVTQDTYTCTNAWSLREIFYLNGKVWLKPSVVVVHVHVCQLIFMMMYGNLLWFYLLHVKKIHKLQIHLYIHVCMLIMVPFWNQMYAVEKM